MTKGLKVLDAVALMLTGVGLIGGGLAAIDVLPAPMGVVCAVGFAMGVVVCALVRKFAPASTLVEHWEFEDDYRLNFPHDSLRLKTPGSDPLDPSVPGTLNWKAQQDSIAKPY